MNRPAKPPGKPGAVDAAPVPAKLQTPPVVRAAPSRDAKKQSPVGPLTGAEEGRPVVPLETVEGEYVLRIDSDPSGATVVINGAPVGKTPYLLAMPGTAHGFFRSPLSVKVRFIATEVSQTSRSVTEEFTSRERIPAALRFTVEGVSRILR